MAGGGSYLARVVVCALAGLTGAGVTAAVFTLAERRSRVVAPAAPEAPASVRAVPEQRPALAARVRPPLGDGSPGTAPADPVDAYAALVAGLPDRASRALGTPGAGRLRGGVRFPAAGPDHITWDPITKRRPSRAWRRVGTARAVRRTLRALHALRRSRPVWGVCSSAT